MRIGIDFDNTLVSYDSVFHQVALERELIPADLPPTKIAVRDYLRGSGHEDLWTEMQGYVYGARMGDVMPFPGAIDFLAWVRTQGFYVAIVSHKTRHPFLGDTYDLHEAARGWVTKWLVKRRQPLVRQSDAFFELTKPKKLARIAALKLDWFIDDLPEILLAEEFPAHTSRVLFNPDGLQSIDDRLLGCRCWAHIQQCIEGVWATRR
jgi:hypothetical protein